MSSKIGEKTEKWNVMLAMWGKSFVIGVGWSTIENAHDRSSVMVTVCSTVEVIDDLDNCSFCRMVA